MPEKKTIHTKKETGESGLTGLIIEGVVRSVQSFIDGTLSNVEQSIQRFAQKLTRQAILLCFGFVGIAFLLIGLAQLLSTVYGVPGIGAMIMGMFILMIVLVVYLFNNK